MKGSLKLRPRRALTRSEAWACFTANLALPGSGSLAAGRVVGYWQMAASFAGLIFTFVTAMPMYQWAATGGLAAIQGRTDESFFQPLLELWPHVRWPVAGFGIFTASILWATATSLLILAKAPRQDVPPRIR